MLTLERPPTYYSVDETAARLRVDRSTVLRWLYSSKLRAYKAGKQWRIRDDDLTEFLERGTPRPREDDDSQT